MLNTRLARLETEIAGRREAERSAAKAEFDAWLEGKTTEAERDSWLRWLWRGLELSPEFCAEHGLSPEAVARELEKVGPFTSADDDAVQAMLGRVPPALMARLWACDGPRPGPGA